jgi:predicted naringenin-chalcone synthase
MHTTQSQAAILGLGTALPPYDYTQESLSEWLSTALSKGKRGGLARRLPQLLANTGIETRYSCLPDARFTPDQSSFVPDDGPGKRVTTAERMAIYQREAVPLGRAAAQAALDDFATAARLTPEAAAASITHLIVVSCTGFFAPGLDQAIARQLGLGPRVERLLVGFMGCAAAFNALHTANQIASGRPDARVLVVCVELCSLHFQADTSLADLIATSIFADGAAACLVGVPSAGYAGDYLTIVGSYSALVPDTSEEMVWRIGDHGFTLNISSRIPELVAAAAPEALATLFSTPARPAFWAIHPGGRSIVDQLEGIWDLSPEEVAPSRNVLRQYGNMSSPTILFVLKEIRAKLRTSSQQPSTGIAMAFGPGLVIEMAKLTYEPAATNKLEYSSEQRRVPAYALA